MNIILLSGGSGLRLWPVSNGVRSKQFLKIFNTDTGKESMLQRVYRMIKATDKNAVITVATSYSQTQQIKEQLGDKVAISEEPDRKDTFPAIVLACAYLRKHGVENDEPVVVCPIDALVDEKYFAMLKKMCTEIDKNEKNIVLMGIKPSHPSQKYGYILANGNDVIGFKEKPDEKSAKQFIDDGALWNSGVFAFKLGYILDISEKLLGGSNYEYLYNNYLNFPKISFDYEVVEKEKKIGAVTYDGLWKDIGTWDEIVEVMGDNTSENVILAESENTHVINELDTQVAVLGIDSAVVVATPDGILVSDKKKSSQIKNYLSENRAMYERRQWGEYQILLNHNKEDIENCIVKHLRIIAGQHISYQIHHNRTEIWTVISGKGKLILNGDIKTIKQKDVITIKNEDKHGVKADTDLHIVELQFGNELTEEDIERLNFDWTKLG